MNSQIVQRALAQRRENAADPFTVGARSSPLRFSSHRALETHIDDVLRLPVDPDEIGVDAVQNEDGDFYFIEGYSHADGPDILM